VGGGSRGRLCGPSGPYFSLSLICKVGTALPSSSGAVLRAWCLAHSRAVGARGELEVGRASKALYSAPGNGQGVGRRRRRCALVSHEQPHLATESGLKYS
jgi:hypothetical protein